MMKSLPILTTRFRFFERSRWRQPTQVLTGSILGPPNRFGLELGSSIWLDIDFRSGELCGKSSVLPLFANG